MKYNTEEINHLIRHRRSVFPHQFKVGENVPRAVIEQALENAHWAPTHAKTEPWRFFVFTGTKKEQLGKLQAEQYRANTSETDFKQAKFEKLARIPVQASCVIAIAMKRQPTEKIPEIEEVAAVACAVQNIHLTLSAYGYGGYWSTGGLTYIESAKAMFGLGEKDKLMGFFYVGVPEGKIPDSARTPLTDKVEWL